MTTSDTDGTRMHGWRTRATVVAVVVALLAPLLALAPMTPAVAQQPVAPAAAGVAVERIGGPTRVDTAVAVSEAFFDRATDVVLARAEDFPDALAAGALARTLRGPILLTPSASLPQTVADEVVRLGADRVTIVGGEVAVAAPVASALRGLGLVVRRVGGEDRYETSRLIADVVGTASGRVVLARGRGDDASEGFADALSSGTFGVTGLPMPTVLTERFTLPAPAEAVLRSRPGMAVSIVGGPEAVSAEVEGAVAALAGSVERLSGPDRFATSVVVADAASAGAREPTTLLLATGEAFADGLVAGALTEVLRSPILLVPASLPASPGGAGQRLESRSPQLAEYLRDVCPTVQRAVALGGPAAVAAEVHDAVRELLTCPSTPPGAPTNPATTTTTTTTTSTTTSTSTSTTTTTQPPRAGVVPEIVGMRQGTAIAMVDDAGLVPRLTGTAPHATVPAGRVLSQDPTPGTAAALGSDVSYVLSSGPSLVPVPSVIGLTASEAEARIDGAGLAVGRQGTTESDTVAPERVDNQLPLAGQQVLPGTPVDFEVATGGVNASPEITSSPALAKVIDGTPYEYDADATDPDSDDLTYVLQAGPTTATIDAASGAVSWNPSTELGPLTLDHTGPQDFVVRVEDGRGGIDTQSWTVEATVPNRRPAPVDDVLTATAGQARPIAPAELLGNDSDPDGDELTITGVTDPQAGQVALGASGLTYTPNQPGVLTLREDIELTHAVPATITSDRPDFSASYPIARLGDDYLTGGDWFPVRGPLPTTIRVAFDRDVAVRRVDLAGARQFGEQGYEVRSLDIRVLGEAGEPLLVVEDLAPPADGVVDRADPDASFDLVVRNGGVPVAGARSVEVVIGAVGTKGYPGLAELDVWGDAEPSLFRPRLKWVDPERSTYSSPTVGDLDQDGRPEVVVTRTGDRIHAYDGATGVLEWSRSDAQAVSQSPAIGDVADCPPGAPTGCRDDHLEVVYVGADTAMVHIAGADGTLLAALRLGSSASEDPPFLADVEGDGDVEIVLGGNSQIQVVDIDRATGTLSSRYRTTRSGCGDNSYGKCIPVLADIDVDGELEVVTGTHTFDAATGRVEHIGTDSQDGFVAVADFDEDPEGEIVRVGQGVLTVLNHDFTPVWGPVPLATRDRETSTGYGGPPTIADFDGDGRPEIGIAGARVYAVYDPDVDLGDSPASNDGVLWKAPTIDGSSHRTGSTVFDFDNDGRTEVVYHSERDLSIWDGLTGALRWSRPMSSATTIEQPVVADADGDGQAEIVVSLAAGRTVDNIVHPPGLHVYEAPADDWVRARPIWNQHAYSVTNVHSDGSIPAVPAVNWLAGGLNNFREQAFMPDDPARLDRFTYTVSDGRGAQASATVHLDVRPPQNDPVITCGPPARATVGFPYRARICADDPDGDALRWTGRAVPVETVTVPGTASPWLAGQPDGTTINTGGNQDRAPANRPPTVGASVVVPGETLSFRVSGETRYTGSSFYPADGYRNGSGRPSLVNHVLDDEHGIQDVVAGPAGALVGVFLSETTPRAGDDLPPALEFSTDAQLDWTSLAPELRQPFYIGDGRTAGGDAQQVTVPPGATRLAFGILESARWNDNGGALIVSAVSSRAGGLSVGADTGVVTWTPEAVGEHRLDVQVSDDGTPSRSTSSVFPISVLPPAIVPALAGTSLDQAEAEAVIEAAGLSVGSVSRAYSVDVPEGRVNEQFPPEGSAAAVDGQVAFTVSLGPSPGDTDADGDGHTPNEGDCDDDDPSINPGAEEIDNDGVDQDCDGEDGGLDVEQVGITGSDASLVVGRTRSYTAQALLADGRVVDITELATFGVVDGSAATVSGRTVTAVAPATTGVTATFGGLTATKVLTVIEGVGADVLPPDAEISSPAPGAEVSTEVEIRGTVSDANLTGWRLSVVAADGTVLRDIGSGTSQVVDGPLGALASAAVPPGVVTVRLDVEDAGGNVSRVEVPVRVLEGPQAGAFSLSFTDLVVPTAGLPLSVVRTYDSRDSQVGDFGAGWRLDLTGLDLRTSRDQGIGWDLAPGRWGSTALLPSAEHSVTIAFDDGTRDVFDLVPSPQSSIFTPLQFTSATYQPRSGSTGTLVPTGNRNLLVLQGADGAQLVDDSTLRPYEPEGFVYTRRDGTVYRVDASGQVSRIQDRNGNVITVDDGGIVHSTGSSVTFTRDALGRITSITDPAGLSQTYAYSAAGDLISHTDAEGNTTSYRYAAGHQLLQVVDPLGRTGVRYEYDDSGRVVAVTDGAGRRTEMSRDLGARNEVITGPDGDVTVLGYDAAGNVVRMVDPTGAETTRTFDDRGRLLTETDPLGRTTERAYDVAGNLVSEVDPTGATTTRTFSPSGALTSEADPLGRTTTFAYDGRGNLLTVTDDAGVVIERLSYDARGNVRTRTDASGATTTYSYDARGVLVGAVDPLGRTTSVARDDLGQPVVVTAPDGSTTEVSYDGRGLPTAVTDGADATSTLEYDPLGALTAVEDATGRRAEVVLDAAGLEQSVTVPGFGTTTFAYTADGERTTATDPEGGVTSFTYDAAGRPVSERRADGTTVSSEYDPAGQVVKEVDARGGQTTYTYDPAGRVTSTTDPLGAVRRFAYDAAGQLVSEEDPVGGITTHAYDASGRRISTTHPDATTETFGYDATGNLVAHVDAAGNETRFAYDAAGSLVEVVEPGGATTRASYDAAGNLASVTDANGHTTRHRYDRAGRLVETVFPSGLREQISYDRAGVPTAFTDRAGETTTVVTDGAGRVTEQAFPDGRRISRAYDATGALVATTDERGTTTYGRDALDRLTAIEHPDGSQMAFVYDEAGNRTSMTAHAAGGTAETTSYAYDLGNRLVTVEDPQGGVTELSYDLAGRPTRTVHPNGTETVRTFDPMHRLATLEHLAGTSVLERLVYDRSAVGDVTGISALDGSTSDFRYDTRRRLVEETHEADSTILASWTYTYDAVGNRLTATDSTGSVEHYTYDAENRLLTAGGVAFAYDPNGDEISRSEGGATETYGYDTRGLLTVAVGAEGVTRYAYDANGERVARSGAGESAGFLVDPLSLTGTSEVAVEYDATGATVATSTFGSDLLNEHRNGVSSYVFADEIGSIRAVTDDVGQVTATATFAAFGERVAAAGQDPTPYGFAGQRLDDETGLYHLGARQYRPETGRFTGVDRLPGVLEDPLSRHPYLYSRANPLTFEDPSGLMPSLAQVAVASGIVTGLVKAFQAPVGRAWEAFWRGFIVGALVGAAAHVIVGSVGVGIAGTVKNFFFVGGFSSKTAVVTFVPVLALMLAGKSLFGVASSYGDFRGNPDNRGKPFNVCAAFVASYVGELTSLGLSEAIAKGVREAAQPFAERVFEFLLGVGGDALENRVSC